MLKKLLAGLTVVALSLGMVALTAAPATAHQGDITAKAVCNTQTGVYDVTYTLSWSSVPDGTHADLYTRTGTTNFANGWGFGTWNDWTDRGDSTGASGSIQWSTTLPGNTVGNGPWVYAYTAWSNNYNGSTKHDTRVEGLKGDCAVPEVKVNICHATGNGWNYSPNIPVSQILGANGHAVHQNGRDIIPPFTYPGGSFPGKNWDAYGQWVWGNDCSKDVTPPPPTFADAQCTGAGTWGSGSYTIPAATGVKYLVSINDGAWVEKSANTYPVASGTKVEVDAVALSGYELAGNDNQWVWTRSITKPSNCDVDVTPTKPTQTQAVCTAEGQVGGAGYTIPSITGVQYQRSTGNSNGPWVDITAGPYSVADGTSVWIRAVAKPGYELVGNDDSYKWKLEFIDVNSSKCVVPADPTPTYSVCTAPGQASTAKYTVPSDTGIQYQRWNGSSWVNIGSGNVTVTTPATVQLRAVALNGYTIVGGPYSWTYSFATPDCIVKVVPGDPTFTDSVCEPQTTGSTQGGYFIPTTANVSYTVSLNGAAAVPATTGSFVPTNPGDQVTITAIAASGYLLSGDTGPWSHTFANPGECLDDATPAKAIFVDAICNPEGTGTIPASYEVVAAANVTYLLSTNGVDYAPIAVNTYPGVIGQTVYIKPVAAPGYQLVGDVGPWSHTFANPGDCLDEAPTGAVTKVDQTCIVLEEIDRGGKFGAMVHSATGVFVSGWITIPSTPNVDYFILPDLVTPAAATDHPRPPGTYTVRAVAHEGYKLTGPAEWVLEIEEAEACGDLVDLPVVTPVVTFAQTGCLAAGSYSLGVEQPGLEDGVIWTVSGGLPSTLGTHTVGTAGLVTITATPADGYGFTEDDGPDKPVLQWSFDFTAPAGDCLPTLALTGGGLGLGGLGLSTLLLLGGALLIVGRQRVGRPAE